MFYPFLENTAKAIQYLLLWALYAILQIIVLYSLVNFPTGWIILDGVVHATVFGLLGVLLWIVIKYGNYAGLNQFQRLINYSALGLLSIALWLGIGYGCLYWSLGTELSTQLIPILPIRGLIGLLIYLLLIQRFKYLMDQLDMKNEMEDSLTATDSQFTAQEIKPAKTIETELLERIAVKSGTKIHVVMVPEILYLQADGDYVQILTANGKYLKEQTMKYFEEHLPENQFVRVHRSVIVNVEMISRIELYEKQNQLLTLKNGQQIKTSPAGYKALRTVLNL